MKKSIPIHPYSKPPSFLRRLFSAIRVPLIRRAILCVVQLRIELGLPMYIYACASDLCLEISSLERPR
jgi:hypothetical protein